MAGPPQIFDRSAYRARRARAARAGVESFLAETAAAALAERLIAVNRRFARALDLGSRASSFQHLLPFAESWVRAAHHPPAAILADEESLPFTDESFDLAVSVLSLHAVNDLPGALLQIRRALKPDGLFMAALFGGDTLTELRASLAAAESEVLGGVSPRVAPFADMRVLGTLLQRAGFALPVTDVERTIVRYAELGRLFADLRAAGETNVLAGRLATPLPRRLLSTVTREYSETFAVADGRLRATFDIVYLTGWAPHDSQQQPLKPGSAKLRLADSLGTKEIPSGEKPG